VCVCVCVCACVCMCVCVRAWHCPQLSYTTHHRTVLITALTAATTTVLQHPFIGLGKPAPER